MDPVSHAALGAVSAEAREGRGRLRNAALAGGLGALAPDADLLIRSSHDPLLGFELHRQFTHSLTFAPVGALIASALLYAVLRGHVRLTALWGYCTLGYATHLALDACTSYGIELLWPFSTARPALSIVSVFDPLFTLPVGALALIAFARRRRAAALAALGWGALYLAFAAVQAERARATAATVAATRGHTPARLIATPSFANTLVWKTVYLHGGRYYVDAIRTGITPAVYVGASARALDLDRDLSWIDKNSLQHEDLERFIFVSKGYVVVDANDPNRVVELRYSLVPHRMAPFWALELDPAGSRGRIVQTAERTPAQGAELAQLVLGFNPGTPIDAFRRRGPAAE